MKNYIDDMLREIKRNEKDKELSLYEEKEALNLILKTEKIGEEGKTLSGSTYGKPSKPRHNLETLNELEKHNLFFQNSQVRLDCKNGKVITNQNGVLNVFYKSPSYISGSITSENKREVESIAGVKCFYYPDKVKLQKYYYKVYKLLVNLNDILSLDCIDILIKKPTIPKNTRSKTIHNRVEVYNYFINDCMLEYQKGKIGCLEFIEKILYERYLLETNNSVATLIPLCDSLMVYSLNLTSEEKEKVEKFKILLKEYFNNNCTIPLMSIYLKDKYYILRREYNVKSNEIGLYFTHTITVLAGKRIISDWCSDVYLNNKHWIGDYSTMLHPLLPWYKYSKYAENYRFLQDYIKEVPEYTAFFNSLATPPLAVYNTWLEHNEITMTLKDIKEYQKKGSSLFTNENRSLFANLLRISGVDNNFNILKDIFYFSLLKTCSYKTCKAVYTDGNKNYSVTFKPCAYSNIQQMRGLDDYFRMCIMSSDSSIVVSRKTLLEMYLNGVLKF